MEATASALEKMEERPKEETLLPSGDIAAESEAMENFVVVQLFNNNRSIGGLKANDLEKTVESYQIIGQLNARVLEEKTKGYYTEQTITQLMAEIDKYHAFYLKPISMEKFQELLKCGPKLVVMDPFERDSSNQPALIMQMHPKLVTTTDFSRQTPENEFLEIKIGHDKNDVAIPKSETTAFSISDHDGYAQSSTPANDVPFVYAQNLNGSKNDDVPKKHIANAVIEALKVPNVMLEGNQIFVTSIGQLAAVGQMSSGSVNSSVLNFFSIAAVTGFLGCLWAM